MERDTAILEANYTRLRPILMTTVMLMAAMVPIALGQGPGASARASMAKVIIGGQALSLVLSLVATPVVYSLLDDCKGIFAKRFRKVREFLLPEAQLGRIIDFFRKVLGRASMVPRAIEDGYGGGRF
jgi:HAE1 family hydrophobic/amphiphilic exporter-1